LWRNFRLKGECMFILRRTGGVSAKELAKLCGAKCGKVVNRNNLKDFIINYGERYEQAHLNKNVNYNKLSVHKFLAEHDIKVPKLYSKNARIEDKEFPVLARKNYHSKGRDIIYIKDKKALKELNDSGKDYDFLVQYIPKVSEYRVHILKGYKIIVNVKVNDEEERDVIVRSHDKGWKHITYRGEFDNALIKLGKDVTDLLQYDFAVIDIIRDKKNNLYVLEVNSAPGLEERKLNIYADFFKKKEQEWLKKNEPVKEIVKKEVKLHEESFYGGKRIVSSAQPIIKMNNQGYWAYNG